MASENVSYHFAICSHGRPQRCAETVANLTVKGFDLDQITVFLSYTNEEPDYRAALPPGTNIQVRPDRVGIHEARNYVTDYYDDGTQVISLDDDITQITQLEDGRLAEIPDWPAFFDTAWARTGTRLWSINPTGNPFYMRPKLRTGLVFCCGHLHGYIIDKALPRLTCAVKEDYERTILYWLKYGSTA
ncbi:MAG: hypothetical protein OER95_15450, partial [Acidimicrobiia bacterium]|nr:hypothetical protein [Acidimicrobiia bacterium]